ncbi:urease accessory protein UreD [Sporosarcina sp. D27]|uniref:urease accessory protein UreD n=1 Tax=Sporosarcina sp. D27 TaxID=1382305 RepID=UPI000472611B|nr:urease accessory protein UreD [Sporosarcina sp. D27]
MKDWTGVLSLDAEVRNGKTVGKDVYFQGAYKVMRPVYHDDSGQACYYILNPGGGYLDGDRYQMQVTVQEEARLTLTTQSATKIYKSPRSFSYSEMEFTLKNGSYLEYIPDPLIGYRDARYKQKTVVHMEKGATLLYSDIITPGWSPDGEKFSYHTLQLKTEIYMDEDLVVFDHIKLSPATQDIEGLGFMEGFSHMGSMIVIGEKSNAALLDLVYQELHENSTDFKIGLSALSVPGFTLRVLANTTQVIEALFAKCHMIVNKEWYDINPSFLRKY